MIMSKILIGDEAAAAALTEAAANLQRTVHPGIELGNSGRAGSGRRSGPRDNPGTWTRVSGGWTIPNGFSASLNDHLEDQKTNRTGFKN